MKTHCQKCGTSKVTYLVTPGITACRNPGFRHRQPIDADRYIPSGVIPAGQDCPHRNQCATFLHGDCVRAHSQSEEFECVFARALEAA